MLRIKELRMQNNLTQDELGKKINLTGKTIWAYENQIATPPLDVLIKLACAFSCSIDYLLISGPRVRVPEGAPGKRSKTAVLLLFSYVFYVFLTDNTTQTKPFSPIFPKCQVVLF